ncbi:hypothetical protein V9T40_003929 [Parthenolecanium corni]|uniref:OSK domain-containing protein n=1 Tax=Parthenolecanium corni TaxID=536013 RepID=A0AAN9Y2Q0_9HEMI
MSDYSNGDEYLLNEVGPVFNGYQLIGDNEFIRFSESVLQLKAEEHDGLTHLGLCVEGQKISDLLLRVKQDLGGVSEKVVVMIGTNDLLRGTSFEEMRTNLELLLHILTIEAEKVILLTVPPVLKLKEDKDHWDRLKKYNEYIKELEDSEQIFVGDAYAEFIVSKESPKRKLSTSSSHSMKCSSSMESTHTHYRKRSSFGVVFALSRLGMPFNLSDETFLAWKRHQSLPLLPQNPVDTTVQRKPRRKSLSFDLESNDTAYQLPTAELKRPLPFPINRYAARVFGDVMSGPLTSSPGVSDSFMTLSRKIPSRKTPAPEKQCNSYSKADVEHNDSFGQGASEDSFMTLTRTILVAKKQRNSFSTANDEQNDSFGQEASEDKVEIETAPKIREEFFEKYYSSDCRRLDEIHLNEKGLRIIGRIIQNTIDSTDR